MRFPSVAQTIVVVMSLALVSACSGGAGGGKKTATKDRVTSQSVANSVAALFSNSNTAALKSQESSSACLDEEYSEDGLTASNEIPAGHYGLPSEGIEFSEDATCAETGFVHWTLEEITGQDCSGEDIGISGEGVYGIGTSESGDLVEVILGTFDVEGLTVTCDIVIMGDSFDASCEIDGEEIDDDTCGGSEPEPDCDSEDGEGCADSCEFASCSMDANDDGVENDPDHFSCQMVADESKDDELTTANAQCVDGCCVAVE